MRILAIRGCNLASLAGEFEIDLATGPLGAAGVFAIVGNTGAGKSTLLDALCVALFDRTPRLANHSRVIVGRGDEDPHALGAQDVRTLLRRGAASGWAEVDFESGDARRYRARWSVRRARGQADGALQAQQVSLTSLDGTERLGGTKTETLEAIHARLGLTFDQFRRSALLAQGDFAAFLRADGKDRGELLERMTGTEIYTRLSVAAHANATVALAKLDAERTRADAIAVLPDDERQRAEQELRFAGAAKTAARTRLTAGETAARWIMESLTRSEAVRAAEVSNASATSALVQANGLRDELAVRRRVESLRSPWEHAQRAERQLAAARGEAAAARESAGTSLIARDSTREQHAELVEVLVPLRAARIAAGLVERAPQLSDRNVHIARAEQLLDRNAHVGADAGHLLDANADVGAGTGQTSDRNADVGAGTEQTSDRNAHVGAVQHAHAALAVGRGALADAAWLSARSSLATEIIAWSDLDAKFAQHATAADSANRLARSLAEHTERREKVKQSRAALTIELRTATDKHADAQRKAEAFTKKRGLTLESARRAEDAARVRKTDVEALVALAASARSCRAACAELDTHLAELTAVAAADAEARTGHDSSRTTSLTLRTERARVVAELRKAAGYEHARAELVDGDPCPLCGADEHPWRHRGALDDVIVSADRAFEEVAAQLDVATTAIAQLDARAAQRKTDRARVIKQRTAAQTAVDAGAPRWAESLSALGELLIVTDPASPEADKLAADLLAAAGKALDAARTTRSQTEAATKAAAEAQADVALCQNTLDQLSSHATELDRKLAELEAAIGRLDGERAMRAERCAELVRELRAAALCWRAAADGIADVSAEPSSGVVGSSGVDGSSSVAGSSGVAGSSSRTSKRTARGTNGTGSSADAAELASQRAWMSELATAWRTRAQNVARAESAVAGAVHAASDGLQRAERAVVEQSAHAAAAEKLVVELTATTTAANDELATARATLDMTDEQLRGLLSSAPARVDALVDQLAALERAVESTRAVLSERSRLASEHVTTRPGSLEALGDLPGVGSEHVTTRPGSVDALSSVGTASHATSRDELKRAIATRLEHLAEVARTADEHVATLTATLTADSDARARREQLQALVVEAERAADVDRILGAAIGSHDGKRFRSFAQSLTLDGLLTVANAHLVELAPRYQLERVPKHDLELQVIDRDLGDEVRSVQSLSGGESFLVSLALALGLSSMSAHDVRVRTLLIDEGFGTLDPSTLEMALSVLEALRQQGRQVGVISHVPQLVERVGAHVRVIARGGGRSEVVVA